MLFIVLISLLDLATKSSAAITPPPYLSRKASPSTENPQNISTAGVDILTSLNSSLPLPPNINPRFTYEVDFAHVFLDRRSAYLNTLLALAELSTKGWTQRLEWDILYSFSRYGDVTIRIHASQNPSSLQYRYAIWGLYLAILESSAHDFEGCLLTLYWSPILGKTRYILGYVSILDKSSVGIDTGNSTEDAFEPTLLAHPKSLELTPTNSTVDNPNPTSVAIGSVSTPHVTMQVNFLNRPLNIDSVFRTIYKGVVYLASLPQYQAVSEPGVVNDKASRTFLRWDSTHLMAKPNFEHRFAIAAMSQLALYMHAQNRFEDARFIVYVDESEVGRGWLYKERIGES